MAEKKNIDRKRVIFEVDLYLHCDIKKRAAIRNISVKKWLLIAISERIEKERSYE
jgi:hypothetical protein